jgi:hypothetical protein
MNRLHKFIKAWQILTKISFGKKASKAANRESSQCISLGGNFYSKDADSILIPMNGEENEFLFI